MVSNTAPSTIDAKCDNFDLTPVSDRYINPDVQTRVLTRCARRCCFCFYLKRDSAEKEGQIAHLDHNRTNGSEGNLAFLCLAHNSLYDSRTSQHKNYTIHEVKAAREPLDVEVQNSEPDDDAEDEGQGSIGETEEVAVIAGNEHEPYHFDMTEGQELIRVVSSDEVHGCPHLRRARF